MYILISFKRTYLQQVRMSGQNDYNITHSEQTYAAISLIYQVNKLTVTFYTIDYLDLSLNTSIFLGVRFKHCVLLPG